MGRGEMMRILLIDADSTIPNLALMRLSTFFKRRGDKVELLRLEIPYHPGRKRRKRPVDTADFDRAFCSCVFEGSRELISGEGIEYGGTGVDLKTVLAPEQEGCEPDYSLYPENNTSYGFLSRGCIRRCYFCKVPEKEGALRQVASPRDIIRHRSVKFMDNNFLGLPNHEGILKELISIGTPFEFNQGLDIRLLTGENSRLLSLAPYTGEYTFALDDEKDVSAAEEGLRLMPWRKDWQIRFFVYVHPKMTYENIVGRVEWLRMNRCLPYVMRDRACWGSGTEEFAVDLAAWCNQPGLFKNMPFSVFLGKRHTNRGRIQDSLTRWNSGSMLKGLI